MSLSQPLAADAVQASSKLYRAVWRWHFYAGLYVIPFLLMLAITGLGMVWFTGVDREYGEWMTRTTQTTAMPIAALLEAAQSSNPQAKVDLYISPWSAENPALFRVTKDGASVMVAIDPGTGQVLRTTVADATWNKWLTTFHGSLMLGGSGGLGDLLIETAASLGIVMVVTGIFLWWPRGASSFSRALIPDFSRSGRAFWKSLHSTFGIWLSVVLLFFLLSGLAWTSVWGGKLVQAWSTFPAAKWDNVPLSTVDHASMNHGGEKTVPWTLEQTPMPESGSQAGLGTTAAASPVTLSSITELAQRLGFVGRYQVTFPADDKAVWTISQDSQSYDSTTPTQDRTVHVDQYSGKILADVKFADYALGGKAMAVGIALHEGQLGWWNVVLNIGFCLFVIFACVSGVIMWWKRRPAGQLSAPDYGRDTPLPKGVLLLAVVIAIAFPLGGLGILLFAAGDWMFAKA